MEPVTNALSSPLSDTLPVIEPGSLPHATSVQIAQSVLSVRMVPEITTVALQFPQQGDGQNQAVFGPGTRILHTPYHRVLPAQGALISLSWAGKDTKGETPRLVRLTVQSDVPDWQPEWVRWVYGSRVGGENGANYSAAAQDVLSVDEQTLTLLLLPGDTRREATLLFSPVLSLRGKSGLRTGDYPFTVWAHDAQTGERWDSVSGRLRLVHPPTQLLDYLPSRYREALDTLTRDENPAASYWWQAEKSTNTFEPFIEPPFFTRYLRGFDDLLEPLQNALGELYTVFGTETAPSEFVPWLAQWVALTLDDNWPELRRRRLIREAVELYRWRGTRRGLSRYLEIYAGVTPVISDQPLRGMVLGSNTIMGSGGADLKLGHVPPHTFVVLIAHPNPSEISAPTVQAIINAQKPAHTRHILRILPKPA